MTGKNRPKVILLENDDAVAEQIMLALQQDRWNVTHEKTTKSALETLAKAKKTPYALFISNFRLPKMEGDDILSRVKKISPFTRRMLIVSRKHLDTLVSAIHKAEIHACIVSPFKNSDMVNQAAECFQQFQHAMKREQLKRVTRHQNSQMLTIAKKLKKKSAAYEKKISEKNTRKAMLKASVRHALKKAESRADINVDSLMDKKQLEPSEADCLKEFSLLFDYLSRRFELIARQQQIEMPEFDFNLLLEHPDLAAAPDAVPQGEADEPDAVTAAPEEAAPDEGAPEEGEGPSTPAPGPAPEEMKTDQDLVTRLLKAAFLVSASGMVNAPALETDADESAQPEEDGLPETQGHFLEKYFELKINEDKTEATIRKIEAPENDFSQVHLQDILEFLMTRQISYGILEDEVIETWLKKSTEQEISIARGEKPVMGADGNVKYHFQTDFTNPGKINEDGSIDFRDRGDIPFVRQGDLIAEKTFPQAGSAGLTISNDPIPIEEPFDPVFTPGSGVTLSEDGTSMHAAVDGQPHCDVMGVVSVNPELVIEGNVDFETGNVDFQGNIVIRGIVKEGFRVRGINVTAQEIEGGDIDITGDLNVSAGITDSKIYSCQNIYAKFINNCDVRGFGDLVVTKEIIDSKILLSGQCANATGHIISSTISAKQGVDGGNIGTPSSKPVHLSVGIDEHLKLRNKEIKAALETSVTVTNELREKIKTLEEEDQTLYEQVSQKAYIQDRSQVEIKEIKDSLPEIENSHDLTQIHQASQKIKVLKQKALEAEAELDQIFKSQDEIAKQIEELREKVRKQEKENKDLVNQRKALRVFGDKTPAAAIVTAAKTLCQDTVIKGPSSSLIIKEDKKRCKIQETGEDMNGVIVYEMRMIDL